MESALAQALATVLDAADEQSPPATPASPFGASAEPIAAAVLVLLSAADSSAPPAAVSDPHSGSPEATALERLSVVLTRRRRDLSHHPGEIAFPGGRRDPADATLLDTALREANEEIGLVPEHAQVLGALPFAHTLATNFAVRPYVALIGTGAGGSATAAELTHSPASQTAEQRQQATRWKASAREVDAVLEVPLSELSGSSEQVQMTRRGFTFRTGAFRIGEEIVWGLTHRILCELMQRLGELE